MDKSRQQLLKFIGASAGLHFIVGGSLFLLPLKPLQPHPSVAVMQVSLVDAVEARPVTTELQKPMETSLKISRDFPVHEDPIMKEPEEAAVDEAPARLEEVREKIFQQPSLSGSDALPAAENFGEPAAKNSSHPEELSRFLQDVRIRLEQAKQYPWTARLRGQEGTVRIQFMIAPSGEVKNVHLMQSSGAKTLDDEAIATLERVGRFSEPPVSWNAGVPIQVPLIFQLHSP